MTRIIGLDIGHKRIGVAVSDETGSLATGTETILVESIAATIDRLKSIVDRYKAEVVVVGLPLNMDGSVGPSAEKVLALCKKIEKALSVAILTFDERLTTKQGEVLLLQADMSRSGMVGTWTYRTSAPRTPSMSVLSAMVATLHAAMATPFKARGR